MKKTTLALLVILFSVACSTQLPREISDFNEGWSFHLGDIADAHTVNYDDSGWRNLTLPYDWAIEGDFSADNPSGAGGGALPGGIGWYRKTFTLDKELKDKKVFIDFDGIYMNSDVWVNGNHLGFRPYGYISFRYDITPYLNFTGENTIAVRVDKNVLHVFPHWNWHNGEVVDIWAYYNNADEAELFLNGVSQGVKKKENEQLHVSWRLNFEPGTLKVISRKNGKEVLSREIKTAGEPYQIKLTADRQTIMADGKDLSFITVEVLDKDGNLCPNADNLIQFDINDAGNIVGVDNGNQTSMERFKDTKRKAFYGKCLVVVQAGKSKNTIQLSASSDNLQKAEIKLKTQ